MFGCAIFASLLQIKCLYFVAGRTECTKVIWNIEFQVEEGLVCDITERLGGNIIWFQEKSPHRYESVGMERRVEFRPKSYF